MVSWEDAEIVEVSKVGERVADDVVSISGLQTFHAGCVRLPTTLLRLEFTTVQLNRKDGGSACCLGRDIAAHKQASARRRVHSFLLYRPSPSHVRQLNPRVLSCFGTHRERDRKG